MWYLFAAENKNENAIQSLKSLSVNKEIYENKLFPEKFRGKWVEDLKDCANKNGKGIKFISDKEIYSEFYDKDEGEFKKVTARPKFLISPSSRNLIVGVEVEVDGISWVNNYELKLYPDDNELLFDIGNMSETRKRCL